MKFSVALAAFLAVLSLSAFAADESISSPSDAQNVLTASVKMGKKLIRIDLIEDGEAGIRNVPVYEDAAVVGVSYVSESEGSTSGKIENIASDEEEGSFCIHTNQIEKEIYLNSSSLTSSQLDRIKAGDLSVVTLTQSAGTIGASLN